MEETYSNLQIPYELEDLLKSIARFSGCNQLFLHHETVFPGADSASAEVLLPCGSIVERSTPPHNHREGIKTLHILSYTPSHRPRDGLSFADILFYEWTSQREAGDDAPPLQPFLRIAASNWPWLIATFRLPRTVGPDTIASVSVTPHSLILRRTFD